MGAPIIFLQTRVNCHRDWLKDTRLTSEMVSSLGSAGPGHRLHPGTPTPAPLNWWMDEPPFWTEYNILIPKQFFFFLHWMKQMWEMRGEGERVLPLHGGCVGSSAPAQLNPFWGLSLTTHVNPLEQKLANKKHHCTKVLRS